jgi:hypothetical protein
MKPLLALAVLVAHSAFAAQPTPPDLAVSWTDSRKEVSGVAGETVEIYYGISNVGGRDAFAVISSISTPLGSIEPARIQPGPAAGKSLKPRKLSLALAVGMSEVCVGVKLQNVSLDDPPDPNLKNNRTCRPVAVRESK